MGYRWLVTVILVAHFAFVAYVVVGGFLTWRWPRAIWPHLAAAGWGLAVVAVPLTCPLTTAEHWARVRAGEAAPTTGFIDRYIEGVLYPERYTVLLQIMVGVCVLGSWLGGYVLNRKRVTRDTARETGAKSEEQSDRAATV